MWYEMAIKADWVQTHVWRVGEKELTSLYAKRTPKPPRVAGAVAVIPIHGVISQRASIWQEMFGGTATESLNAVVSRAAADDKIKAIVLDVDSPGGTTAGVWEAAETVRHAAAVKPVVAVSNSLNASAAYWISSQASQLYAAPGSETGSIGVFMMHHDLSKALEGEGVATEFIAVPEFKTEGNPFQPLSDEARQHYREQVNDSYEQFVKHVAGGRKTSQKAVKEGFGKGRVYHAEQAKERGMVDGVATLAEVLEKMGVDTGTIGHNATITSSNVGYCDEDGNPYKKTKQPPAAASYERFTDRARRSMQLANQEAQRFNHEYLGTEHILLGIIKEGSGIAAKVLENLGVDMRSARIAVEKRLSPGPEFVLMGALPKTPRARSVIELARKKADELHHNYIGTEHILLGLAAETEGVAYQVLKSLGIVDKVEAAVIDMCGSVNKQKTEEQPPIAKDWKRRLFLLENSH